MQNNLGRLGGQLGVLLTLLGLLIIFFGWNGAASTDYVPAQFPYLISGGVVGIAVVVVGAAMILVQNFRTDMARLEADRFPAPEVIECEQYGSKARYLTQKLNPDVPLTTFLQGLYKAIVA